MAKPTDSKKPRVDDNVAPLETHAQTQKLEEKRISPQHNTTEAYGTSSEDARRKTAG